MSKYLWVYKYRVISYTAVCFHENVTWSLHLSVYIYVCIYVNTENNYWHSQLFPFTCVYIYTHWYSLLFLYLMIARIKYALFQILFPHFFLHFTSKDLMQEKVVTLSFFTLLFSKNMAIDDVHWPLKMLFYTFSGSWIERKTNTWIQTICWGHTKWCLSSCTKHPCPLISKKVNFIFPKWVIVLCI